jgi:caspase domain-containing protein
VKRITSVRLFLLVCLCWVPGSSRAAAPPHLRPIAIVVGANQPAPGRQPLRYALADAQLMADTLLRVGRFAPSDVHTLLEPRPAEILAALDDVARATSSSPDPASLLVFYYSGHSDGQYLFPHGEPLPLAELRRHIEGSMARVRIAIVDTCRGGGWTGTKGLSLGPPLDAVDLMNVETEGTALVSSSSGLENAHEAAALKGSFFTHHIAAGLLGAADKSGDGNVTLQEVFEYARDRTIRDSARMALTTQHPSFDLELRGRQDIALAQLTSAQSLLELTQVHALELVHLQSGVTVLETPPGRDSLRLALPPGQYLVRRVSDGRVYSKEIDIRAGDPVRLDEAELTATGDERLASKGASPHVPPGSLSSTLPGNSWEIRLGIGSSTGTPRSFGSVLYDTSTDAELERSLAANLSLTYGITDRLSLTFPLAFAYRLGDYGSFEWVSRAGLVAIGYSAVEGLVSVLDAGVGARVWLSPELSLVSNASVDWASGGELAYRADSGVIWHIDDRVALSLGAGWAAGASNELVFGSVQTLGYRSVPLVSVFLSPKFSLDAYVSWAVELRKGDVQDRYLGGFTWLF